jgi:hypothetical protein
MILNSSLYTSVTCNQYNIRTELLKEVTKERCNYSNATNDSNTTLSETNANDTTCDNSISFTKDGVQTINIIFSLSTGI